MARTVGIGIQNFEKMIKANCFYVDKTHFIREWWESGDDVTLITRPRRFGKTLNMSMIETFFSVDYADRADLFEGFSIFKESGLDRYDVMIEPKDPKKDAFILEFKVHDHDEEKTLEDTLASALAQIEEKQYEANLIAK